MLFLDALVTPNVMLWARKQSGLSIVEAAAKAKRKPDEIEAWEMGMGRPTITQARKLSEIYRRPLAVFYLPEPPTDFETLRDFRRLPEEETRSFSNELFEIIRKSIEHQAWTREFLEDEGVSPLSFVSTVGLTDSEAILAKNILETFEITPQDQCKTRTRAEALRLWIKKVEQKGIYVFRKGGVDPKECRGFVISDYVAPFIYLNSEDAVAGQLFTLIHELAHIWIGSSGVSNIRPSGVYQYHEFKDLERFCNQVASLTLLNEDLFNIEWTNAKYFRQIEDRIVKLSNVFKVSEEVVARRLLQKGILTEEKYLDLRNYYQERWMEQKQLEKQKMRKKKGGPSYYVNMIMNNGYAYTQTVLSAYGGGKISSRHASSLLDVKVNNFSNLASKAGIRLPSYF